MYRISRILLMTAGFVLAAGASLIFGFGNSGIHGSVYMAACLLGLAVIYCSSRGLSEQQ